MKKTNILLLLVAITFSTVFAKSTLNLAVKGMHCSSCETKFKAKATSIDGVSSINNVSSANNTATIEFDEKTISAEKIIKTLADQTGYTITASINNANTTAEGKPAACCQKGQKNAACSDKDKNAKKKCDKK